MGLEGAVRNSVFEAELAADAVEVPGREATALGPSEALVAPPLRRSPSELMTEPHGGIFCRDAEHVKSALAGPDKSPQVLCVLGRRVATEPRENSVPSHVLLVRMPRFLHGFDSRGRALSSKETLPKVHGKLSLDEHVIDADHGSRRLGSGGCRHEGKGKKKAHGASSMKSDFSDC